jgi:MoaA/NifB/PqqE/SkfB family radical SAM enzyme
MMHIARKLPLMRLFRAAGRPRIMPFAAAYSVTHRCNSRCATCGVAGGLTRELDTGEWRRVFDSLGRAPRWITVTGGEPFMRDDILELCRAMAARANPAIFTIATNGFFTGRIAPAAGRLAKEFPQTDFFLNISLDGIGAAHDRIRGLPGGFDAALDTFHTLRNDQPPNLQVGFHTVISTFNIDSIPDLIRYAKEFRPDAHAFEIAQPRAELNMQGKNIAPTPAQYRELLPLLENEAGGGGTAARLKRAMRAQYHALAARAIEEKKQIIPCCAGFASIYIAPDGALCACPTLREPMGSLPASNYDFLSLWRGARADLIRESISRGRCHCALANAALASMAVDPASAFSIVGKIIPGILSIR